MEIMKIPNGLGEAGKDFWTKILGEYDLQEAHDLERLTMACKCLDDVIVIEERVKEDGRFTQNRYGGITEHPGGKSSRDTRALFMKIIRELNLDIAVPESRPPRKY